MALAEDQSPCDYLKLPEKFNWIDKQFSCTGNDEIPNRVACLATGEYQDGEESLELRTGYIDEPGGSYQSVEKYQESSDLISFTNVKKGVFYGSWKFKYEVELKKQIDGTFRMVIEQHRKRKGFFEKWSFDFDLVYNCIQEK